MSNTLTRIGALSTTVDTTAQRTAGALLNLFLRWYVGWQFFKSGMLKLKDWDSTLSLFHTEYHTPLLPPDVAAVMGAFGEITFPLLLFIGLFSRPAAIGLFFVNCVAVISYPALFKFECPAAINDHFYWGMILVVIAVWGAGLVSVDGWLARGGRKV